MVTCSSRGTPSVHHRIPFNRISYLPLTDCRHIYGVRVQRDVELTLKIGSVYRFLCCFPPFNNSVGLKKLRICLERDYPNIIQRRKMNLLIRIVA